MKLYNTLTKNKEKFIPLEKGKVGLYTCGPTVYGYQHIGNYKSFMTADVLRRYLMYRGYEVRHIQNITDVGHLTADDIAQGDSGEDKILKKARTEKKTPEEIAEFYTSYHIEKSRQLNMLDPHLWPRATKHIPHIITIIKTLIKNDIAYEKNGNVFLDVTKAQNYGTLSGNTLEKLKVGARLEEAHPDKKNQWDFALWLGAPKEHLMQWDSPWGRGYPGWHIECSAMSMEYLGETFDIHTGGEDHIFPHHEAEIAQSEGATETKFVNYWLHTRHMMIDGKKMSKSKGNLYTLEDIETKSFTSMDLRMLYLLSHYRSQMNFTWGALHQAKKNRESLEKFYQRLCDSSDSSTCDSRITTTEQVAPTKQAFEAAMDDDLNTPLAITIILKMVNDNNTALDKSMPIDIKNIKKTFEKFMDVLGLKIEKKEHGEIPAEVKDLLQEREHARKTKDFAKADALRDQIKTLGYTVEDATDGQRVTAL